MAEKGMYEALREGKKSRNKMLAVNFGGFLFSLLRYLPQNLPRFVPSVDADKEG